MSIGRVTAAAEVQHTRVLDLRPDPECVAGVLDGEHAHGRRHLGLETRVGRQSPRQERQGRELSDGIGYARVLVNCCGLCIHYVFSI